MPSWGNPSVNMSMFLWHVNRTQRLIYLTKNTWSIVCVADVIRAIIIRSYRFRSGQWASESMSTATTTLNRKNFFAYTVVLNLSFFRKISAFTNRTSIYFSHMYCFTWNLSTHVHQQDVNIALTNTANSACLGNCGRSNSLKLGASFKT